METPIVERDRGFRRNIIRSERLRPVKKPLVEDVAYSRHENIYRNYLEKFLATLGKGHPIRVLLAEHKEMTRALEILDRARENLEMADRFEDITVGEWELISQSASNLEMAHLHFHKEESILFPELVERGRYVDVQRVLSEHRKVHTLIFRLIKMFEKGISENFEPVSKSISETACELSARMRRLIYQENYFLYPMALRLILEDNTWERIKAQCQAVGRFHLAKPAC